MLFTIRNAAGEVVRRLSETASSGLHRTNWDLRFAAPDPVDFSVPEFIAPLGDSVGRGRWWLRVPTASGWP